MFVVAVLSVALEVITLWYSIDRVVEHAGDLLPVLIWNGNLHHALEDPSAVSADVPACGVWFAETSANSFRFLTTVLHGRLLT